MDAQTFWNVIGQYNHNTILIQIILLIVTVIAVTLSYALPLYLICGFLFLFECWHNKNDILERPNLFQVVLLGLYCFYPLISFALGNQFPQMVTHIMPCPIVSLSIRIQKKK